MSMPTQMSVFVGTIAAFGITSWLILHILNGFLMNLRFTWGVPETMLYTADNIVLATRDRGVLIFHAHRHFSWATRHFGVYIVAARQGGDHMGCLAMPFSPLSAFLRDTRASLRANEQLAPVNSSFLP